MHAMRERRASNAFRPDMRCRADVRCHADDPAVRRCGWTGGIAWKGLLLLVATFVFGCSPNSAPLAWKSEAWKSGQPYRIPKQAIDFATPKLPHDAVVLEVAVAQLDDQQRDDIRALMERVDVQAIGLARRQVLDRNGVWAGVLTSGATAVLNRLLADKPIDFDELEAWQVEVLKQQGQDATSRMILHQRVQLGMDQEHQVPVSDVLPVASWVVEGAQGARAGQGEQVRGYVRVRIRPSGGETTRIQLDPEFHYGEKQARFGVSQGDFAYESSQAIWELKELRLELDVRPGETVVVTAPLETSGVGGVLFGPGEDGAFGRRMLLIRLAQTRSNDLFDASRPSQGSDGF